MIDWTRLTLFLYIAMRMSGFVLFSPLFGRRTIPGIFRAGLILVFSVTVFSISGAAAPVPRNLLEFMVQLVLELGLGYALGFVVNLFFYIPQLAGHTIDTQMGLSMASTYDASSQINSTISTTLINVLMTLLFFAANGHYTLIRILLSSGDIVPFGAVALGSGLANAMAELFIECTLLAVKLCFPVLAAELIGQFGMGILMKAIPQINAFVINIELKVILGFFLLWILISPFSEFLLDAELQMLSAVQRVLSLAAG